MGYQYGMTLRFDGDAVRHSFTLRCMPCDTMRQRVLSEQVSVSPSVRLSRGADGFGNAVLEGTVTEAHSAFSVSVQGSVEVPDGEPEGPVPEARAVGSDVVFKYHTPRTEPGPAVRSLASAVPDRGDPLSTAVGAMETLQSRFSYQKGVTGPDTTAEEALAGGCGVCQDYAQIMVSAMRCLGIPARYVVGYSVGEGESHAWAEVLSGGLWYGLDPTGCTAVGPRHIKVSHGRDYGDCRINRGVFYGAREESQSVHASVTPIQRWEVPT